MDSETFVLKFNEQALKIEARYSGYFKRQPTIYVAPDEPHLPILHCYGFSGAANLWLMPNTPDFIKDELRNLRERIAA